MMGWGTMSAKFKCGACGTEAGPFAWAMDIESFQKLHASLCLGYPPIVAPGTPERSARLPDSSPVGVSQQNETT